MCGVEPRAATATQTTAAAPADAKKARKLLYYRNPMGLPDTSPVPKKDPMGMDYIAVYEGGEDGEADAATPGAAGQIKISTEKIQKLGVRTEAASLRDLARIVHAVGRVEADELLTVPEGVTDEKAQVDRFEERVEDEPPEEEE